MDPSSKTSAGSGNYPDSNLVSLLQMVGSLLPGQHQSSQSPLNCLLVLQVSPVHPHCSGQKNWCGRSCHPRCCAHVHLR